MSVFKKADERTERNNKGRMTLTLTVYSGSELYKIYEVHVYEALFILYTTFTSHEYAVHSYRLSQFYPLGTSMI